MSFAMVVPPERPTWPTNAGARAGRSKCAPLFVSAAHLSEAA